MDGELSLDGRIAADGGSGTLYSGGGSGGSVWLIAASLVGTGTISATGGNSGPNEGGGGGGGRVAICVMHASNGPVPSAEAEGGNGYQAGQAGLRGTVHWPLNCPPIGGNFMIDPRGTYLHTNQDPASDPRIIDLQSLGITPGDMIELQRLGDFDYVTPGDPSLELTAMIAVFSSSNEPLQDSTLLDRIAEPIDAGEDFTTINTHHGSQLTDINEDFWVDGIVIISVPTDARYLFVAAHDEFYSDNGDTDGDYAIRVTKLPDGDFDNDGVVDMADYGVWRANFGAISGAGLAADGNFDGQVNAADYVLWRKKLTSGMMSGGAPGSLAPVAELSGSDEPTILAAKSEIQSAVSDQGGNRRQVDFRYLAQSQDIYRERSAHYTGHRGGRVVGLPRTDNLAHTGRPAAIELLTQSGTFFSAKSAVSNEEDYFTPFNRGIQNESHLAVIDEAITHVEWCNSTGRNSFVALHRKPI